MVKILSLSFCVKNFLPGENPGQPFYKVWRGSSPPRGNAVGLLGLGASPASHHLGLRLRQREPGDPRGAETCQR